MSFVGRSLALIAGLANRLLIVPLAVAALWLVFRDPPAIVASHVPAGVTAVIDSLKSLVRDWPRVACISAAALLLLNLRFLLVLFPSVRRRRFIHSHATTGESRVALSAIRKALKATARQVPEVTRARIRVLAVGRRRYRVHVGFRVRDVASAGSAAEHLRILLKRRFSELVLLDPRDRVDFDFDLEGIDRVDAKRDEQKRLPPPRDGQTASPESFPEAFKGPVYPVGGEIP